jgi:hypothetical protein
VDRRNEAAVTIDGRELSDEQAGTLRTAMTAFTRDLELAMRRLHADLGPTQRSLTRCREIVRLLEEAKVG